MLKPIYGRHRNLILIFLVQSKPMSTYYIFALQLQLYYYMQKVASAGMGNPKERKECPICGKTLYDRSTWNRHMRIHTGECDLHNLKPKKHITTVSPDSAEQTRNTMKTGCKP